jgi:hypothetical protein
MKVWVFVEGESDAIALNALWSKWRDKLRRNGWGIQIIPLDDKSRYFRKIGHRAAEKLVADSNDLVVGLPDLYPNAGYIGTVYEHKDLIDLKELQMKLVKNALKDIFGVPSRRISTLGDRFYPTALKHDLEMLLLAAYEELRSVLGTRDRLGAWSHPVEDQNQQRPPKFIVEELFRTKKRRAYRDTIHASAVLNKVSDINTILYNSDHQIKCPVFKEMLDWIGEKTNIPGY